MTKKWNGTIIIYYQDNDYSVAKQPPHILLYLVAHLNTILSSYLSWSSITCIILSSICPPDPLSILFHPTLGPGRLTLKTTSTGSLTLCPVVGSVRGFQAEDQRRERPGSSVPWAQPQATDASMGPLSMKLPCLGSSDCCFPCSFRLKAVYFLSGLFLPGAFIKLLLLLISG